MKNALILFIFLFAGAGLCAQSAIGTTSLNSILDFRDSVAPYLPLIFDCYDHSGRDTSSINAPYLTFL